MPSDRNVKMNYARCLQRVTRLVRIELSCTGERVGTVHEALLPIVIILQLRRETTCRGQRSLLHHVARALQHLLFECEQSSILCTLLYRSRECRCLLRLHWLGCCYLQMLQRYARPPLWFKYVCTCSGSSLPASSAPVGAIGDPTG